MKHFKGTPRPEAFNRWKKDYEEGKPWAKKVLAFVMEIKKGDFADF